MMHPTIAVMLATATLGSAAPRPVCAAEVGSGTTSAPSPTAPVGEELLTLERVRQLTRENNVDMRQARERLQKASVLTSKAWGVLMPVASARAGITRNDKEIPFSFGGKKVYFQRKVQGDAAMSFRWSLFNGRAIPLIQKAYTAVDIANLSYQQTQQTLVFAASLAYYNAVNAERQVDIRQRALTNTEKHLALAQARVEVGSATRMDVLRSRAEIAAAQQASLQAENGRRLARQSLAVLIGWVHADGTAKEFKLAPPPPAPSPSPADALAQAYDNRLDLKVGYLRLTMAKQDRTETLFKFAPALFGTGNYRWDSTGGIAGDKTTWQLGLSLEWTFFEGGLTYWELQERAHDLRLAELAIDKTKQVILEQVTEARLNLESSAATQEVADRRVELASQTAELVNTQYEIGAATELELLDANRSLADAETAQALAELGMHVARLQLQMVQVAPPLDAIPSTSMASDPTPGGQSQAAAGGSGAMQGAMPGGAGPSGPGRF